ncbi:hypothetical protein BT96DRAFT_949342 [Gymnopus androsaceus JB14]|uniref:Uncharacterized protein n=1 Tax=Gymnopus androsaceus JB14 TaxID=1447944 RepID=A0A6A4GKG8_9AGAR|nr:hypothetical protein BT96DRAFT_949342 [Gymnopus androsaceus JB14]
MNLQNTLSSQQQTQLLQFMNGLSSSNDMNGAFNMNGVVPSLENQARNVPYSYNSANNLHGNFANDGSLLMQNNMGMGMPVTSVSDRSIEAFNVPLWNQTMLHVPQSATAVPAPAQSIPAPDAMRIRAMQTRKKISKAPGFTKHETNQVTRYVQRGFLALMGVESTRKNGRKILVLPDSLGLGDAARKAPDGTELLTPDCQPSTCGHNENIIKQVAIWTANAIKAEKLDNYPHNTIIMQCKHNKTKERRRQFDAFMDHFGEVESKGLEEIVLTDDASSCHSDPGAADPTEWKTARDSQIGGSGRGFEVNKVLYCLDTFSRRSKEISEQENVGVHGNRSGGQSLQTFRGLTVNTNYSRPRRANPMEGTIDHHWIETYANDNFLLRENPEDYNVFSLQFQKSDFDALALAYLGDDEYEEDVEMNKSGAIEEGEGQKITDGQVPGQPTAMEVPASQT